MKSILLILFLVVVSVVGTIPWSTLINVELDELWETYKAEYGKTYNEENEISRRKIWEENFKFIQKHNIEYNLGKHRYTLGVNEFTDLTHKEFKDIYLKYGHVVKSIGQANLKQYSKPEYLPDSVNWIKKGYVTKVKNQEQCGSCWAFSTIGSMEGQYYKKTKRLVSLSEQQLVDCSQSFGNEGCDGGLMNNTFQYIMKYGLEKENVYPYTATEGECQYFKQNVVAKCKNYTDIIHGSENDLAIKLAKVGPISVAIDASHPSFQLYKGGVYDEEDCSSTELDHGVLAVGYGVDEDSGENYWLVKNSWGTTWGINGYIKMSKDKNNQCGIATSASYPII